MRIIPAIDIIGGKCVRLKQGAYDAKTTYSDDPLSVAKSYEDAGLQYLHLVDLDGAKQGHVVNLPVLQAIARNTNLVIDFGGGVGSDADVQAVFDAGAAKVTCGSIAVRERQTVLRWLSTWGPGKLILGADCRNGMVATGGWLHTTQLEVGQFIQSYLQEGFVSVICTDIACDGMMGGPSIALYRQLMHQMEQAHLPMDLIASGGVSSIKDLRDLAQAGLGGAIVGKALYEQAIQLPQLLEFQC